MITDRNRKDSAFTEANENQFDVNEYALEQTKYDVINFQFSKLADIPCKKLSC